MGMGTPSFKRQTTGVLNALKMQRRLKFISQDSENLERAIQRRSSAGRAGRSWCGRAAAGSSSADGAGRGSGKGNRHSKKRLGMLDALGHGRGLAHSAASARLIVSDLRGIDIGPRGRLFLYLYEPGHSRLGLTYSLVAGSLTLSSVVSSLQTVPSLVEVSGPLPWLLQSVFFNAFFTLDAMLRLVSYHPITHAMRDPFLLTTMLSVAPFWARLVVSPSSFRLDAYLNATLAMPMLRVFESLATLRLLCLCRYYEGAQLLCESVGRCTCTLLRPATVKRELDSDGMYVLHCQNLINTKIRLRIEAGRSPSAPGGTRGR